MKVTAHIYSVTNMFSTGVVSEVFCLVLLLTLVREGLGHIMCSVCDTDNGDTHCEDSPPPPVNCTICAEADDLGNCIDYPDPPMEYCMTVRKYDDNVNRTVLGVIRSCSAFHMRGKSCFHGKDTDRGGLEVYMCHTTCEIDGCNTAYTVSAKTGSVLLAVSTSLILSLLRPHY